MVWYFIGVYIINRTLRGRLEIRNFSSRVEKIFHEWAHIFQHSKRNFVSPRGHVISSIYPKKTADISRRHHSRFLTRRRLRNKRRNSILITRHYSDLGSASARIKNCFNQWKALQSLYLDLGSDASSVMEFVPSFPAQTSGFLAKCRLFQAKPYPVVIIFSWLRRQ